MTVESWIETRAVLAAAYRNLKTTLTHAVECDETGHERVLCGRVKVDHLADPLAVDVRSWPTCEHCQHQLQRKHVGPTGEPERLRNPVRRWLKSTVLDDATVTEMLGSIPAGAACACGSHATTKCPECSAFVCSQKECRDRHAPRCST